VKKTISNNYFLTALSIALLVVTGIALQKIAQKQQRHLTDKHDFASTNPAANSSACRFELLTEPMTPEKVQSFISDSRIKSANDLICCLPENYRQNYVVMHSSFALQAGIPDNPRVLLFNFENDGGMIFTITGSQSSIHGSHHVEAFFHNQDVSKNELYDIDFSKNQRLMEKNPKQCMGCHSPSAKELDIAGVKPIFQDFPWPGSVGFSQHLDASKAKNYFQQVEAHARRALQTDPAYACLQPASLEKLGENANIYDSFIVQFNNARVAQLIEQSKDYQKIRPLLVGMAQGCFAGNGEPLPAQGALDFFEQEFPKWIPSEVANRLFSDSHFMAQNLRSVDNIQQAEQNLAARNENAEQAIRMERSRRKNLGSEPALYFPTHLFSALYKDDLTEYREIKNLTLSDSSSAVPPKTLSNYSNPTKLLARYVLDTDSEPHMGLGIDPYLRFLFEARGLSILTWGKEMAGSHGPRQLIPVDLLQKNESDDPFWKSLTSANGQPCDFLRAESYKNFSTDSP